MKQFRIKVASITLIIGVYSVLVGAAEVYSQAHPSRFTVPDENNRMRIDLVKVVQDLADPNYQPQMFSENQRDAIAELIIQAQRDVGGSIVELNESAARDKKNGTFNLEAYQSRLSLLTEVPHVLPHQLGELMVEILDESQLRAVRKVVAARAMEAFNDPGKLFFRVLSDAEVEFSDLEKADFYDQTKEIREEYQRKLAELRAETFEKLVKKLPEKAKAPIEEFLHTPKLTNPKK